MFYRSTLGHLECLESRRPLAVDLVADIYAGSDSSRPKDLTSLSAGMVFTAEDAEHGRELWVSDGTGEGTRLVKDVLPGPSASSPLHLTAVGARVFFVANVKSEGAELWVSDGTEPGTTLVKQIEGHNFRSISNLVAFGDTLLFSSSSGLTRSVWSSDGTSEGTIVLQEFGANAVLENLTASAQSGFFTVRDDMQSLWSTDGTAAGTTQLMTGFAQDNYVIENLTAIGDELFFLTSHENHETLWSSDGSIGGTTNITGSTYYRIPNLIDSSGLAIYQTCQRITITSRPDCGSWFQLGADDDSTIVHPTSTLRTSVQGSPRTLSLISTRSPFRYLTNIEGIAESNGTFYATSGFRHAREFDHSEPGILVPKGFLDDSPTGLWQTDLTPEGTQLLAEARGDVGEVIEFDGTIYVAIELDETKGMELYRLSEVSSTSTVQFTSPTFQISEDGGGEITISRSDAVGSQRVSIEVETVTASLGRDVFLEGNLEAAQSFIAEFPHGVSQIKIPFESFTNEELSDLDNWFTQSLPLRSRTAAFSLRNDDVEEEDEFIRLRLWPASTNLVPNVEADEALIRIVDDGGPRIVLGQTDASTKVVVDGAVDTISVKMNYRPSQDVVVVSQVDERFILAEPNQLVFNSRNWDRPQFFRIKGLAETTRTLLEVSVDDSLSDPTAHSIETASVDVSVDAGIVFEEVTPRLKVANINTSLDDVFKPGSNPRQLTNLNGELIFAANDGVPFPLPFESTFPWSRSPTLWSADQVQTKMLATIPEPAMKRHDDPRFPGIDGYELTNFVVVADELVFNSEFFYTWASGNSQIEFDLLKTDGTAEGIEVIGSSYDSLFLEDSSLPLRTTHVKGNQLYFDHYYAFEFGFVDGDPFFGPTTRSFHFDGQALLLSEVSNVFRIGESQFFAGVDESNGRELWVTHGPIGEGRRISDIGEGALDGLPLNPAESQFTEFNGMLYFVAQQQLWKSDGTPEGTELVASPTEAGSESILNQLFVSGERLFFVANGAELFSTDGTGPGTTALKRFTEIGTEFVEMNGAVYFAGNGDRGLELWRTDGSPEGTTAVADIFAGNDGSAPADLVVIGDRLFFAAADALHGRELWASDGTEQGTELLADVNEGSPGSDPTELTSVGHQLFFAADDGARGRELWQVDTRLDTVLIGDTNGDDRVNFADFLVLSANFGNSTENGVAAGDIDENGVVEFADFLLLSENFGRPTT